MARRKTSNVHTTKATTTAAQKVEATKAVVEEKAVEVKEAVKETAAKAEEAAKETVEKAAEKATEAAAEVKQGVQVIQYQVITLMTTNGQAPFVTVFILMAWIFMIKILI